ncbi:MAG: hypothetical protein Q8Q20_03300 [bacterium]|nr:hypothetical protein [bacterium]
MPDPQETKRNKPDSGLLPELSPLSPPGELRPREEKEPQVETGREQSPELDERPGFESEPTQEGPSSSPAPMPAVKEETEIGAAKEVENILEEDLREIYAELDPATRQKFKQEGEKTAGTIAILLQATKVKVKKVLSLIKKWLKIIPGLNKHFIEQEAKIKTDKVLAIKRKSQGQ